jgi:hypothetical protein
MEFGFQFFRFFLGDLGDLGDLGERYSCASFSLRNYAGNNIRALAPDTQIPA